MQRRLLVVVVYGVAAGAWIVISSWVVAGSLGDATGEIAKGLGFIVVTAALLYALLVSHDRHVGESSRRLRSLIEAAGDITFRLRVEPHLQLEYLSESVEGFIGVPAESFVAQPDLVLRSVHPEDRSRMIELLDSEQPSSSVILRWVTADGRTLHARHDTLAIRDRRGRLVGLEGRVRDVTEERLAIAEAAINESMLGWIQEACPVPTILSRTCDRLTAQMEVELAWIGVPAPDGSVRVVASSGDGHYTDGLEVRWDAGPLADGPSGSALREGRAMVALPGQTAYRPWRQQAIDSGYTASLAVPIRWHDEVRGVLNVYSQYGNPFDEGLTSRFDRIARRIGLALADPAAVEALVAGSESSPRSHRPHQGVDEGAAAITGGHLEVWWQPQVDAATGRAVALEALVRGRDRDGGLISPAVLLPTAERADLLVPLGRAVRRQAIDAARPWLEGSLQRICLNVTIAELVEPGYAAALLDELDHERIGADQIELELIETAPLTDPAIRTLTALHRAGVRIAIDDYGSGWASLGHLAHLPTNTIKIDRVFIRDLGTSDRVDALVRSTIQLGAMLGLTTVAEGVEQAEQARRLSELGCDLLQGFHFSPPVPSAQVPDLLDRVVPAPAATAS